MIPLMFAVTWASITTTMTFDFGAIVTALAPTLAVIVTWYLQRKSTQHAADKVASVTLATASRVAEIHQEDTAKIQDSLGAVHTLVNGKNDALLAENRDLREQLAALKK